MKTSAYICNGAPGDTDYPTLLLVNPDERLLYAPVHEQVLDDRAIRITPAEVPGSESERMNFIHQLTEAGTESENTKNK